MNRDSRESRAQVVLPTASLQADVDFFTGTLGFRLETIFPADAPDTAELSGHGLRVCLSAAAQIPAGHLQLYCARAVGLAPDERTVVAPNGTRIELIDADAEPALPPLEQAFEVTRATRGESGWVAGRAGMRYRDLIPGREGGRFVGSHIVIPEGGPVPDYVHYHEVRFQMIYCYRGWARLVYEDQGPPFVMQAGDCVLQPPRIRHRVLEASPGLEVVELGSPARHLTRVDHGLELPTAELRPQRDFDGQRFVWHRAEYADWVPWHVEGFEARDLGFTAATGGLADATVARCRGARSSATLIHRGELLFRFVLSGSLELSAEGEQPVSLGTGDAMVVPAGQAHGFSACSGDLSLLEVRLPA